MVQGPQRLIARRGRPHVQLYPTEDLTFEVGWSFFRRYSDRDGFYTPGGGVIRPGDTTRERYTGSEASLIMEWDINRYLHLSASVSRIFVGAYLEATGPAADQDHAQVALTLAF